MASCFKDPNRPPPRLGPPLHTPRPGDLTRGPRRNPQPDPHARAPPKPPPTATDPGPRPGPRMGPRGTAENIACKSKHPVSRTTKAGRGRQLVAAHLKAKLGALLKPAPQLRLAIGNRRSSGWPLPTRCRPHGRTPPRHKRTNGEVAQRTADNRATATALSRESCLGLLDARPLSPLPRHHHAAPVWLRGTANARSPDHQAHPGKHRTTLTTAARQRAGDHTQNTTVVPPSFKAALPPSFTEAPSRPAAEKAHTHNSTLRALNPFVWAPSLTRSPHSRPQTDLASEPQA